MKKSTQTNIIFRMAIVAIFSAFVGLSGIFAIPLAGGAGYLNVSDVFIIIVSCAIDPISGLIVGAVGGGLADLFSGFLIYLPFTIIIKSLEGLLIGYTFKKIKNNLKYFVIIIIAILCAGMYMIPDLVFFDLSMMINNLPFNALQAIVNASLGLIIAILLKKRYLDKHKS